MAAKRRNTGATIHTTAEFVRAATQDDWHTGTCGYWKLPRQACNCTQPIPDSDVQVVTVTHNGTSHERLLYQIEKRKPLFVMPRAERWTNHSPYVPCNEYLHRISVSSCGVDLWPRGWKQGRAEPVNYGVFSHPFLACAGWGGSRSSPSYPLPATILCPNGHTQTTYSRYGPIKIGGTYAVCGECGDSGRIFTLPNMPPDDDSKPDNESDLEEAA